MMPRVVPLCAVGDVVRHQQFDVFEGLWEWILCRAPSPFSAASVDGLVNGAQSMPTYLPT